MTKTKEEVAKMTVNELKAALKELGQPVTGKKDELVERYLAAQEPQQAQDAAAEQPDAPAPAAEDAEEPAAESAEEPAPESADANDAAKSEEPEADGKHTKIVFSEKAAATMPDTKKLVVVKPQPEAASEKSEDVSDADKLKKRAERFGVSCPELEKDKAKARAQRFGTFNADLEKEKAKARAERFGVFNPDLEEDKKRKRAERFGVVSEADKAAQRAARFKPLAAAGASASLSALASDFEAKKKARAERFGAAK